MNNSESFFDRVNRMRSGTAGTSAPSSGTGAESIEERIARMRSAVPGGSTLLARGGDGGTQVQEREAEAAVTKAPAPMQTVSGYNGRTLGGRGDGGTPTATPSRGGQSGGTLGGRSGRPEEEKTRPLEDIRADIEKAQEDLDLFNKTTIPLFEDGWHKESRQAAQERLDALKSEWQEAAGWDYDAYADKRSGFMKALDSILDAVNDATEKPADVAGKAVNSGLAQFTTGVANFGDLALGRPLQALGWKNNPLSRGAENMNAYNEYSQKVLMDAAGDSKAAQVGARVLSSAVAAAPAAIMAFFTGGGSLAGTTAGLEATAAGQGAGVMSSLGQSLRGMMRDPGYWTSFIQEAGNSFNEARQWAKDDNVASIYAMTVGLINAGIEVGLDGASGIQGLEKSVREGNTAGLRAFLQSAGEEGLEEIKQGLVSRGLGRLMGSGAKDFSLTDPDAVVNPYTMAEEGAMGAATAALMTGTQLAGRGAINALGRAYTGRGTGDVNVDAQAAPAAPETAQAAQVETQEEAPANPLLDAYDRAVEAREEQKNNAPEGGLPHISMEDFTNNESPVWNNVDYNDTETRNGIQQSVHDEMVAAGQVVQISESTKEQVSQAYPDLRGMKRTERTKLLKEKIGEIKANLRQFLNGLKGGSYEFEVNGNILEARLYETGVREVLDKINKDKASMLYETENIFRNSRYLYSTPDYEDNPNIYRWNYFYTPVQIGDDIVGVRIAVRDIRQGENHTPESQIYNWGIKRGPTLDGGQPGATNASSLGVSSVEPSLDTSLGGGKRGVMPDRSGASSDGSNTTVPQSVPDVNSESRSDGLGAANRGFSTPTRGDIVYTQNKTMDPGADITQEESERYAPGVHEEVSEEMSLERALSQFYQGENGQFVNIEDTIDTLLEKENWSGTDQDAAQIAFRWMNAHRDSLTDEQYTRFWALHRAIEEIGGTEAGRSLQARQKWVASGDGIVSKSMSILDDPRIDKEAAKEVLKHIQDLSEMYDRAVEKENGFAFAEIVREVAVERKTSKTKENGELKKTAEWALRQILEHSDVEFLENAARSSIIAMAQDYVPQSLTAKAKAIRRDAMLSKISTWARNVVSNNVFDPIDSVARDISVPLDMALSKITGTRSAAWDASWLSKAKQEGSKYGLARSFLEVALDISAEGAESKYGQAGNRTFKMNGGTFSRFMSQWEKISNYAMYSTDQLQKGGIEAEIQRGVDQLYEKGLIKDDSLKNAGEQEATYRTFQEDSAISKGLSVMRRGLNQIAHVGELGLGDILMPFVQVPANLVDITVDYSPLGVARGLVRLTKTLYDAHNGNMTAAQQARAVQTIGRSITGTGLLALAVIGKMAGALVLSDDGKEEDADKSALESQSGLTGTQLNLSALMRKFRGEDTKFQEGDTLMSIGFMDPLNALLNMGSLIADDYVAENEGEKNKITLGEVFKDVAAGVTQSVMDLPMMSPFADAAQAYQYSKANSEGGRWLDAAEQYAAGQVTSFIPNNLKGIAQGTDTKQRDLYSSDSLWGKTLDSVKASILGLRQTLPVKQDSFGREMEVANPFLNFINNNILPGQITEYRPRNEELQNFLDDVYSATGSITVYPDRKAPNSISKDVDGDGKSDKFTLSYEDKRQYQQTYGTWYEDLVGQLMESEDKFTSDDITEIISGIKSYAGGQAKQEYYDRNDIETSASTNFISKAVAGVQEANIPFVTYLDFWAKKGNLEYEVDEKGKRKVKEAVIKLIDSFDLTDAQKDWLFASENYKNPPEWN